LRIGALQVSRFPNFDAGFACRSRLGRRASVFVLTLNSAGSTEPGDRRFGTSLGEITARMLLFIKARMSAMGDVVAGVSNASGLVNVKVL
jgi:hypothetical protein